MANIEVKLRRGTDTEHSSFTGAEGEVTVDTTNDTLRVHDGSTAGGIRLAKLSEVSGGTGTVTEVDAGTGLETNPVSGIVGTGTIGISDGGVGTTQLANDAVTFAKMQDINTAKVIGRTTVGSGNPEEVSILDEDAMTSNSATALATQQSIKAYVDAQVAASTVSKYSSGWFTGLANGGTYTFTHNLGTKDINVTLWMATDSSGSNQREVNLTLRWTGAVNSEGGAQILNVSTTQLTVQLADQGWLYLDSNGDWQNGNWGTTHTHIKTVAIG